jgi:hypothetical protein
MEFADGMQKNPTCQMKHTLQDLAIVVQGLRKDNGGEDLVYHLKSMDWNHPAKICVHCL